MAVTIDDDLSFLFDFDGVLADSLDLYAEAVARCLERIGTPIVKNREDYLALFDGNFYESMAARGVDLAAFAQAAKEILPGIDYDAMKPFDGLIPVLEALQKDHLLAVISSNGSRTIRAMLERFGFDPYFQEILGSDFLFSKKEKIDHALEKYGIPPGEDLLHRRYGRGHRGGPGRRRPVGGRHLGLAQPGEARCGPSRFSRRYAGGAADHRFSR